MHRFILCMSLANESKPGRSQYVDLLRSECACYSLNGEKSNIDIMG